MSELESGALLAGPAAEQSALLDELNIELEDVARYITAEEMLLSAAPPAPAEDIRHSASPALLAASSTRCWGAVIAGEFGGCDPTWQPGGNRLGDKVCERCHAEGSRLPVGRIRGLHSGHESRFANGHASGLFSQVNPALPPCRLINHTRDCSGPRLVIFESDPPAASEFDDAWAAVPPEWVEAGGFVRLWTSNGTFVAKRPRKRRGAREPAKAAKAASTSLAQLRGSELAQLEAAAFWAPPGGQQLQASMASAGPTGRLSPSVEGSFGSGGSADNTALECTATSDSQSHSDGASSSFLSTYVAGHSQMIALIAPKLATANTLEAEQRDELLEQFRRSVALVERASSDALATWRNLPVADPLASPDCESAPPATPGCARGPPPSACERGDAASTTRGGPPPSACERGDAASTTRGVLVGRRPGARLPPAAATRAGRPSSGSARTAAPKDQSSDLSLAAIRRLFSAELSAGGDAAGDGGGRVAAESEGAALCKPKPLALEVNKAVRRSLLRQHWFTHTFEGSSFAERAEASYAAFVTASQGPRVPPRLVCCAVLLPLLSLLHAPGRVSLETRGDAANGQLLLSTLVPSCVLLVAAGLCTWHHTAPYWRLHVVGAMTAVTALLLASDGLLEMRHWTPSDKDFHSAWQLVWMLLLLAWSATCFALDWRHACVLLLAQYAIYVGATTALYTRWWEVSMQGPWVWSIDATALDSPDAGLHRLNQTCEWKAGVLEMERRRHEHGLLCRNRGLPPNCHLPFDLLQNGPKKAHGQLEHPPPHGISPPQDASPQHGVGPSRWSHPPSLGDGTLTNRSGAGASRWSHPPSLGDGTLTNRSGAGASRWSHPPSLGDGTLTNRSGAGASRWSHPPSLGDGTLTNRSGAAVRSAAHAASAGLDADAPGTNAPGANASSRSPDSNAGIVEVQLPHNKGHSRFVLDCLGLGTVATVALLVALRRINRFERQSFINTFILMHKTHDQHQLLAGGRVELLALFSNPSVRAEVHVQPLKLGQELRSLLHAVPSVYTAIRPAAALADVADAMQQHNPQIALFSGHCFMGRLAFELPSGELDLPTHEEFISMLQVASSRLRGVVLNGCDCLRLGAEIVRRLPQVHVICWASPAEDAAARTFAHGFYDEVGTMLVTGETLNLEASYDAGLHAFREAGFVVGDPQAFAHPPSHPHHCRPCFDVPCDGCCPPVHGRPVLLWSVEGEVHGRDGEGGPVRLLADAFPEVCGNADWAQKV